MSILKNVGYSKVIDAHIEEIQDLYLADDTPWTIGYSGGKDSTAVTQLVWIALEKLPESQRSKPVFVITTDTLVENPIVSAWVKQSLDAMVTAAKERNVPFSPHLLTPEVENTFWVNLIGRGYPAPRPKFRWCTERLKIKPSTRFVEDVASQHGEVILLLGARKSESIVRAQAFKRRERIEVRERLAPHPEMTNALTYTPIEAWSDDDVWLFLLRQSNPWGHSNKDLLAMYRGASEDNECPVVVDTSTPSCGNSRFGCWTCTLVDQDKSMAAMIQNDYEKEWMLPLLDIRNELDFRGDEARERDRARRDFRRMSGGVSHYKDSDGVAQIVHGPYVQGARARWLRRVLEAQTKIRSDASSPEYVKNLELITLSELEEIRRIWVSEKHEVEDLVPSIYVEATGEPYPQAETAPVSLISGELLELLRTEFEDDRIGYETARNALAIEKNFQHMNARRGIFQELESTIRAGIFRNIDEAREYEQRRVDAGDMADGSCGQAAQPVLEDRDGAISAN